jgi:hypothetical protein
MEDIHPDRNNRGVSNVLPRFLATLTVTPVLCLVGALIWGAFSPVAIPWGDRWFDAGLTQRPPTPRSPLYYGESHDMPHSKRHYRRLLLPVGKDRYYELATLQRIPK